MVNNVALTWSQKIMKIQVFQSEDSAWAQRRRHKDPAKLYSNMYFQKKQNNNKTCDCTRCKIANL